MDIEKIRKWLEITNEYKQSDFWSNVLKQKAPEHFFESETRMFVYDLFQDEESNYIIVEMPGVFQEELSIRLVSKTQLLIKGIVTPVFPAEMEVLRERFYGEFERVIKLPESTESHLLQLQLSNGLLHISYPRQIETVAFDKGI
ncbi:Hsp20/alpha crystallin family protein [Bacillus atrophaeus]|uniref:Hsp20/alpha crystallin family protein n=1 Tax=Bacillus atrophaeus TaxID=1452 RepID=UPI000779FA72|nr:Hsp20/alpha crystallin family protein [Bacillus atrophaeus]KXZ18333.1 spore coat protein [Bacillus atrophaeus]MED4801469.1 Hsp20/alpha crystallin family protein [Bacillus atrophaeus]MED4804301.1 Hsp20/alpha crystallin family protein [Bacillus atrophaeus]MED4810074.1 Hsp20/alpha crystallin family protein [Bacillus atrophaeus]MED4810675.1 Hsp20/alpha crystallin family protein [Bacillus atrophaeus]